MEQQITCINCPQGCRMTVVVEGGSVISVTGNVCKRGDVYARQECIAPLRMVTAVIPLQNRKTPLSVKTRTPIPKQSIPDCMNALSQVKAEAPVAMGQIILADVCGTGVDVIATKAIE